MTTEVFDTEVADQGATNEQKPGQESQDSGKVFDDSNEGRPAGDENKASESGSDSSITAVGELFSQYVGEGKKFKDAEDLAKGKKHADEFIEHLLQEKKEMQEELERRQRAEEALSKAAEKAKEVPQESTSSELLDEARLAELVKQTMTKVEQDNTAKKNLEQAGQKLTEIAGSVEAGRQLLQKAAKENGFSVEELKELGSRSPTALMRLVGEPVKRDNPPGVSTNTASSAVNTSAQSYGQSNPEEEKGSRAYFNKLRRENPDRYFGKEVQLELLRAKQEGRYK